MVISVDESLNLQVICLFTFLYVSLYIPRDPLYSKNTHLNSSCSRQNNVLT